MVIQWFPGHMTKALRMMENELKAVDVVIYVLDSRAPFSCINPKFSTMFNQMPILYVFSKIDMANAEIVKGWREYFDKPNTRSITIDSTASGAGKKIPTLINELCAEKIARAKAKNIQPLIRAMVIGVPNSGKSTLINNLCGKAKTKTANIAGVTRAKQWVRISDNLEILDTPGTLWPAFDNNTVAKHLAYIGSIKENVLYLNELAFDFIAEMRDKDKSVLENRYNISITDEMETIDVFEAICEARKHVMRGGDYDYDRCAIAIINDFKTGKMGQITLEKVSDIKLLTRNDRLRGENNA